MDMCVVQRQIPLKFYTYNVPRVYTYVHMTYIYLDLYLLTPPNRFKSAYTAYLQGKIGDLGCMI